MASAQERMASAQERMRRRLAKKMREDEKQSLLAIGGYRRSLADDRHAGPQSVSPDRVAEVVSQLSPDERTSLLRVDCGKLRSRLLDAHERLTHVNFHSLRVGPATTEPGGTTSLRGGHVKRAVEAALDKGALERALLRWYTGEYLPCAHEPHFLGLFSNLLWRNLVATTKDRIVTEWEQNPALKPTLPWQRGHTAAERRSAMRAFLIQSRAEHRSPALGLVWIGGGLPNTLKHKDGTSAELKNPKLSEALMRAVNSNSSRLEFTVEEWQAFGISNLRLSHYITVEDGWNSCFVPAESTYFVHNTNLSGRVWGSLIENTRVQGVEEMPFEEVVEHCTHDYVLHQACMYVLEVQVRHALAAAQGLLQARESHTSSEFVEGYTSSEFVEGYYLEYALSKKMHFGISSWEYEEVYEELSDDLEEQYEEERLLRDFESLRNDGAGQTFLYWYLMDRITWWADRGQESMYLLMLQVARELEQRLKDYNPSELRERVPSRDVGYVHDLQEQVLDFAPHYEEFGAQDTRDLLERITGSGVGSASRDVAACAGAVDGPRELRLSKSSPGSGEHTVPALWGSVFRDCVLTMRYTHKECIYTHTNVHINVYTHARKHSHAHTHTHTHARHPT